MSFLNLYKKIYKGHTLIPVFLLLVILFSASQLEAKIIKDVTGEGEAAVVGMTAEQCRSMALRRARADAVEKAAGTKVLSSTLIRDAKLVSEFLKSFSHGFIVKEKVKWLPLTTLGDDEDSPPIPYTRLKSSRMCRYPKKGQIPDSS